MLLICYTTHPRYKTAYIFPSSLGSTCCFAKDRRLFLHQSMDKSKLEVLYKTFFKLARSLVLRSVSLPLHHHHHQHHQHHHRDDPWSLNHVPSTKIPIHQISTPPRVLDTDITLCQDWCLLWPRDLLLQCFTMLFTSQVWSTVHWTLPHEIPSFQNPYFHPLLLRQLLCVRTHIVEASPQDSTRLIMQKTRESQESFLITFHFPPDFTTKAASMAPSALSNHLDSSSTDTAAAPATNNASSARMATTKLGVRCWGGWNLSWAEKVLRANKTQEDLATSRHLNFLTIKGASVPASPPQAPQRPVLRIGTPEKPIWHRNTSVVVAAGHLPTCASVLSKRSSRGRWARISWDGQRLRISINHRQFGPHSTESVSVVFCGQKKWSMIWSMSHIVLCTALRLGCEIATVLLSNRTQSSERLLKAPMIWFCAVTLNTSPSVNRHSKLYSLEPNIFFCPLW